MNSMTHDDFIIQINKLKRAFGDRYYPDDRSMGLWEIVRNCALAPFENTVTAWIVDAKAPPVGEQFRDFAKRYHRNNPTITTHKNQPSCHQCVDTGWVYLRVKPELREACEEAGYPTECSAICTCNAGLAKKAAFEQSNEYRDIANRTLKSIHHQWYNVEQRWFGVPGWANRNKLESLINEVGQND